MNEFSLIKQFFTSLARGATDVLVGIGDDAACLSLDSNHHLLVSTDTLVQGVHFLPNWDAYDIAYRAVMANISDIAAMAGTPRWLSLALTMPALDEAWLLRFSLGLKEALTQYNIELVGGDTTKGPLTITFTIQGIVEKHKAVLRSGAKVHDKIYLTGPVGSAAFALTCFEMPETSDKALLMQALMQPTPRVDFRQALSLFATACIDISDGLAADLNHLCESSQKGALLLFNALPIHPTLKNYAKEKACDYALFGGDDYQLCFTVSAEKETEFLAYLDMQGLKAYCIGHIEALMGLRLQKADGVIVECATKGYSHF